LREATGRHGRGHGARERQGATREFEDFLGGLLAGGGHRNETLMLAVNRVRGTARSDAKPAIAD
jgi:hypothetical protein